MHLYKKETQAQVFSCGFSETFKNKFLQKFLLLLSLSTLQRQAQKAKTNTLRSNGGTFWSYNLILLRFFVTVTSLFFELDKFYKFANLEVNSLKLNKSLPN